MRLNIINGNSSRTQTVLAEIEKCGIADYKLWEGVRLPSVKKSINLAHKKIVEYAYENDLPYVIIAEDDFKSTHSDSWKFYLSNFPKEFDLYLGGIFLGDLDENNMVKEFTGLTLYSVSKRYYPTFLSVPDSEHIDHSLSKEGGVFKVCNPFPFIQYDGVSSNTGKYESYGEMFKYRRLFAK